MTDITVNLHRLSADALRHLFHALNDKSNSQHEMAVRVRRTQMQHVTKPMSAGIGRAGIDIEPNAGEIVIPRSVEGERTALAWINSTIAAIQSNQLAA